jgi:hypothetical protein
MVNVFTIEFPINVAPKFVPSAEIGVVSPSAIEIEFPRTLISGPVIGAPQYTLISSIVLLDYYP